MCYPSLRKILLSFLILTLLFVSACAKPPEERSEPSPSPPSDERDPPAFAPALSQASWPDDDSIAYCPVFEEANPASVSKQEGNQAKAYVLKFEGISVEQYLSYVEQFEASDSISVDANTNLRDNAYSLNAHKRDDAYMMIRVVYTRSTQSLVVSVTYAHPDVVTDS